MRKIDWEHALSDEDIAWLRQSGQPGMEERIERHQVQFDAEVPENEVPDDTVTQSALDPSARLRGEFVGADSAPVNLTPENPQAGDATETEDDGDDYDSWKVAELKDEVAARNKIADEQEDVTMVEVTGTGKEGAITKADVIKALRFWDDENPGVLDRLNAES